MAVDMSGVLKPVKAYEITEGRVDLGSGAMLYAAPNGWGHVDVWFFPDRRYEGWSFSKETLMNLSEAARLLAEALP